MFSYTFTSSVQQTELLHPDRREIFLPCDPPPPRIDPSRKPLQYYLYAEEEKAKIVEVFERHPYADFGSSTFQAEEQPGRDI